MPANDVHVTAVFVGAGASVTKDGSTTYYRDFGDALIDVQYSGDNSTVLTMFEDATLRSSTYKWILGVFTLDLNGNTLMGSSKTVLEVDGYSVLTVIDSSGGGAIINTNGSAIRTKNGGTLVLAGGAMSGGTVDIENVGGSVLLRLAESKSEGASFPGGITVSGCTLADILDEGTSYWQNDKPVTITENQVDITGGNVIIGLKPCTTYTIEHYKQNLDGTYPTDASDTEAKSGPIGTIITAGKAEAKAYAGFSWNGTEVSGTIADDGTLVLKLYYTRNTYTVTFVDEDGKVLKAAEKYTYDTPAAEIVKPADPVREGKRFLGWYTDDGERFDFSALITEDIFLTAKYEDAVVITHTCAENDIKVMVNGIKNDATLIVVQYQCGSDTHIDAE